MAQFVAVAVSAWIMSRIERRPAGVYGLPLTKSALSRFAAGYLLWGFLPLTAILLIMRALGVFYFGNPAIHGSEVVYWGLSWGVVFLTVGLFEEYLFRGYALYTLSEGIGFWPAAIVLGVLFARAHMGNGGESHIGILDVFNFAIFAAATLRRTGNLWLAVGAHAGWDWGESFFYGVSDSGYQAPGHLLNPQMQGPDWLSGGSVGPEGSIVTLIFWVLMTVGVLVFYRPRRESSPIDAAAGQTNTPETPSA
jgi:membrane protease YdiL (CAAX protease family)